MKLLIVLSVIACGYAAKLDRTYLPPANAGSAGGGPGSLNTPLGPSGFGQPAGFNQPASFNQQTTSNQQSGFNAGKPTDFGTQQSTNAFGAPSNQYLGPSDGNAGPAGSSNAAFNGNQNYQRNQPQRAQASADQAAEILRSDSQNDGETFSYSFETSNGISAEESGVGTNGVIAQGAFQYSDDEGQTFRVQYTADENGYQPQGDHLPTPHPIPEDILRSIEKNAQAAASGTQEGAYNPDEDNQVLTPQQYNNAPKSYQQAGSQQSGQNFNQDGKAPSPIYGAPSVPRPQGTATFSQGQGPQQYNSGSRPNTSNGSGNLGQSQNSPSQLYGAPSNGNPQGPQQYSAPSGARPAFSQQGQQQYSSSSGAARPSAFGQQSQQPTGPSSAARPSAFGQQSQQPSGPVGAARPSAFGQQSQQKSGPSGAARPSAYGQQSQQPSRPAGVSSFQGSQNQAQDASGYQYNRPQPSFGGNGNGQSQFRPQNGVPSSQGFSRPSTNGFSGSNGQASFGGNSNPQNSYGSASQSSSAPSGSFGSPRPNASLGTSGSQPSFGSNGSNRPQAGSNGQGFRPQGQATKTSMSDSGYQYNRPGNFGAQQNKPQFGASPSGNPQFGGQSQRNGNQGASDFGGPRAPPSFSEEEGYKY